ncbi:hypothetical protein FRC10_005420, partial [Ceratobasidium sp. 414]
MATFPPDMLAFAQHMANFIMPNSSGAPGAQGKPPAVPAPTAPANLEAVFRAFAAMAGAGPKRPDADPVDSEASQREHIVFKLGDKPQGTARRGGKNGYNLQKRLKLESPTYKLIRRVTKNICIRTHMDMRKSYGKQPSEKLTRAQEKLLKVFPEFGDFDDPYWPINAFLLVVLKGTSQAATYALKGPKMGKGKKGASAPEEGAAPVPVKGGEAAPAPAQDEDPVSMLVHDTSMLSVRDNVNEDEDDEDEDEDDEDNEDEVEDDNSSNSKRGKANQDIEMVGAVVPPAPTATLTPAQASHHGAVPAPNTVPTAPAAPRPRPKMRPPPVSSHAATPIPTLSANHDPDPAVIPAPTAVSQRATRSQSHFQTPTAANAVSNPAPCPTARADSGAPAAPSAAMTAVSVPTPIHDPTLASGSDHDANTIRNMVENLDPEAMDCLPAFLTQDRAS